MKTTTTRSVAYEHLLTSQPCNPTCEDVESHVRMRAGAKKDKGINTKLRGPTRGSLTDWSGKWTLLCRKSNEKCCQRHEALLRIFTQHHQPLSLGAKLSSGLDTSPALSYAVGVPTSSRFPWCFPGLMLDMSHHFTLPEGCRPVTQLVAVNTLLSQLSGTCYENRLMTSVTWFWRRLESAHGLHRRPGRAQGSQWDGALAHSILGFSGH